MASAAGSLLSTTSPLSGRVWAATCASPRVSSLPTKVLTGAVDPASRARGSDIAATSRASADQANAAAAAGSRLEPTSEHPLIGGAAGPDWKLAAAGPKRRHRPLGHELLCLYQLSSEGLPWLNRVDNPQLDR